MLVRILMSASADGVLKTLAQRDGASRAKIQQYFMCGFQNTIERAVVSSQNP